MQGGASGGGDAGGGGEAAAGVEEALVASGEPLADEPLEAGTEQVDVLTEAVGEHLGGEHEPRHDRSGERADGADQPTRAATFFLLFDDLGFLAAGDLGGDDGGVDPQGGLVDVVVDGEGLHQARRAVDARWHEVAAFGGRQGPELVGRDPGVFGEELAFDVAGGVADEHDEVEASADGAGRRLLFVAFADLLDAVAGQRRDPFHGGERRCFVDFAGAFVAVEVLHRRLQLGERPVVGGGVGVLGGEDLER